LTRKIVISIVDDDKSVRDALSGLMKSCGYLAEAFDSSASFLSSDRLRSTDCLIADVQMPGMTGLELFDRLVASGESIPTILITAHPSEMARARALQAGVSSFLTKPFNERELLACIYTALG